MIVNGNLGFLWVNKKKFIASFAKSKCVVIAMSHFVLVSFIYSVIGMTDNEFIMIGMYFLEKIIRKL